MALGELPERAVGAGEVRVRVDAAGVNPVDAGNRADPAWAGIEPPYVVGYEFAGEAIEVGDDVGHLLVQLARARGARIAAAASRPWHALLERLGVEVVVDRRRPDALAAVREAVGSDLPVAVDLVGGGCLAASLALMAEGGRAGSIVELAGDLDEALDRNLTLHGLLVRPGVDALAKLAELVEAGVIRPEIDEILPLEQAERAHERVESGSGQGKLVLSVPH
jgi:NADPH:quinone reductase-like Zn-dependent oxidoreductase